MNDATLTYTGEYCLDLGKRVAVNSLFGRFPLYFRSVNSNLRFHI